MFSRAKDREGAYDFLESPHVEADAVGEALFTATAEKARGSTAVYVVLDITQLTLTDEDESKGFGVLGASNRPARGLCVMNAYAVGLDGVPLGLIDQQYWAREIRRSGTLSERHAMNRERPFEDKQGAYFVRAAERASARLSAVKVVPWFVVDREGDCRDILEALNEMACIFAIRGAKNRRLSTASDESHVRESLLLQPPLGTHRIDIGRNGKRAARSAEIEVRAKEVELNFVSRRFSSSAQLKLHAVWVRETDDAPDGLDWMLYTNAPIQSERAAMQIVDSYRARWRVEEFHRTWKKGECNVESAQLRSFDAVVKWATVLAAVAVRIERLKYISRATPELAASVELAPIEVEALVIERRERVGKRTKVPDEPTIGEATRWLAEMGGWMGLKSSGPPGSVTLARGLNVLAIYVSALQAVRHQAVSDKRRK